MIYICNKNEEKSLHNNQIHLYKNHYLQGNAFIQSCYTFVMSKENIHTNPFCMDRLQISMIKFYLYLSATVMTFLSVRTGSEEGSYVITNTFEAPNFPKNVVLPER